MLSLLKGYYSKLRILSIDVVIGTLLMTYLFSVLLKSELSVFHYVIIGCGVWLTYTLDHLLDAKRIKHKANTARHLYHQQNYSLLLNIWYLLFLGSLITSFLLLPRTLLIVGLTITVLVLIHFIFIKVFGHKVTIFLQKEFLIALIYTSGVSFIPIMSRTVEIDIKVVLALIQVFLVALINLVEFSFFEYKSDTRDNSGSLVRFLGMTRTKNFLMALLLLSVVMISATISMDGIGKFTIIQLVFCLMILTLSIILFKANYFMSNERYRIYGDLIFIYPIVLIIAR